MPYILQITPQDIGANKPLSFLPRYMSQDHLENVALAEEQIRGSHHSKSKYTLVGGCLQHFWDKPRCQVPKCKCQFETFKEFNRKRYKFGPFKYSRWYNEVYEAIHRGNLFDIYDKGGLADEAIEAMGESQAFLETKLIVNAQAQWTMTHHKVTYE